MNAPSPNPAGTSGQHEGPRSATNPQNMRNIAGPFPMVTHNTTQSQDNHAPHGAHANWFGTTTHIGSGESAQFQNHQLGFAQPATHQFNFSPGSYATFPTQQYQNINRLETHQPSHNTPAGAAEERAFQKDWTEFMSEDEIPDNDGHSDPKKSASQPTVDVNEPQDPSSHSGLPQQPSNPMHNTAQPQSSFHQGQQSTPRSSNVCPPSPCSPDQHQSMPVLTSSFTHHPQQSHEHQPMHHPNPLDPNVSAQYDDPSHEACPRAFEHAPANGTSDQSGVNAQSYQESMPQTQTEPSKTKKRQRSKAGGSNGETPKKRKTATRSETVDWVATAYMNSYQGMTAEAAEERLTMRIPMDFAERTT
jgi:hypothetical protein